jgi:hypothetical protein
MQIHINVRVFYLFYAVANQETCLPKLLQFITGSKAVPPLGLPKGITVKFKHGCPATCKCRPTSSTCDLSITCPVHTTGLEELYM